MKHAELDIIFNIDYNPSETDLGFFYEELPKYIECIEVKDFNQFGRLVNSLKEDVKCFIWVHPSFSSKIHKEGYPSKVIRETVPELQKHNIDFTYITRSTGKSVFGEYKDVSEMLNLKKSKGYYTPKDLKELMSGIPTKDTGKKLNRKSIVDSITENNELKENLKQHEEKLKEFEKSQAALSSQVSKTKESLLQEKQNCIHILENQKRAIDIETTKAYRFFKIKILGIIVLSYALAFLLVLKFGWSKLELWTWIIGATLPVIISAIYMLVEEKTINPIELLKSKKMKITEKKYNQFDFDISLFKKLKSEMDNLKNNK